MATPFKPLRRARVSHRAAFAVFVAALFGFALAHAQNAPAVRHEFPPGSVLRIEDLPASKFRTRLERLPAAAQQRALDHLRNFHFTELDLATLDVDGEGAVLYVDNFALDPAGALADPEAATVLSVVAVSPFPASLKFHSKPGAPNILYLNFSGSTVSGTAWNTSLGRASIPAVAFSTDGDYATFNDAEQVAIKRVWQRMAEDYAPFNIDVTTEPPPTFTTRTAEALITRTTDADGNLNPSAASAGGVAYVDCFANATYAKYRPAWIYFDNLSSSDAYIAEAASHEIGHNMGLSHDGTTSLAYYGGHGSGDTSWGPLMGTGYGRNVSQWSRGEYYQANNTQDDLATIATKVPYRSDDHGATPQTATALIVTGTNIVSTTPETDPANTTPANKGVLERNTDVDVFSVTTGSGVLRLAANPWVTPSGTRGGNLDVLIELRDTNGTLIATNNAASTTGAQIQTNVSAGTYYLHVRNTSAGDPLAATPTGYTSYGSIGQYFISGFIAPTSAPAATVQLVTSVNNAAWGSVSPGTGNYPPGSSVQVQATPAPYYRFVSWTNGASGTNNPLTLLMQTNVTIRAVFAELTTTNHLTPYWWLASYGYTNNFETAANVLGANGMPLWQSYVAGLNPTIASSQLRLTQSGTLTGAHVLNWNTTTGRLYTLWSSTNATGNFVRVSGASNLTASVKSFTNNVGTSVLNRFYRLEVRLP
jgi:hypothetical protein